jgi:hypothetical protein
VATAKLDILIHTPPNCPGSFEGISKNQGGDDDIVLKKYRHSTLIKIFDRI